MDITKDIMPMTTFRNNSAKIMQLLKETQRPVILTVNGKAAAVLQDAEAYQRLLDLAAEATAAEGIRQGLEVAPARRASYLMNFAPSMAYRVNLTERATRDLTPLTLDFTPERSRFTARIVRPDVTGGCSKRLEILAMLPIRDMRLEASDLIALHRDEVVDELIAQSLAEHRRS
jgi:prevent-host-death family protein